MRAVVAEYCARSSAFWRVAMLIGCDVNVGRHVLFVVSIFVVCAVSAKTREAINYKEVVECVEIAGAVASIEKYELQQIKRISPTIMIVYVDIMALNRIDCD